MTTTIITITIFGLLLALVNYYAQWEQYKEMRENKNKTFNTLDTYFLLTTFLLTTLGVTLLIETGLKALL